MIIALAQRLPLQPVARVSRNGAFHHRGARLTLAVASLAAIFLPSLARADDGPSAPPPTLSTAAPSTRGEPAEDSVVRPRESRWYGWQTLLVDVPAIVAFAVPSPRGPAALTYAGLGLYALGAPAVHLGHGRGGIAAADLGLRVGAPLVLGFVGMAIEFATTTPQPCGSGPCSSFRGVEGFALGFAGGSVAAVIVDASVLAYEKADPEVHAAMRASRPPVRIAPIVAAGPRGGSVGIGGTF
jgi:hypothetical protein